MFYTLEITKRVDLQHSQHKKKWKLYDMMEVSAKAYGGDHFAIKVYQINTLYTFNLKKLIKLGKKYEHKI